MAEYNSFTYDEIKSSDFGVYIGGEKTFDAPSLRGQSIEIPGRNGNVFISSDSYENVELVYPSFNFEPDLETFRSRLADLRNALSSRTSYKRLTDTLHPDEFRMAVFRDGFEAKPIKYNTAAEFDIVFDCKPQRFLKSGEIPVEYTPGQTPSDEQTKTGSIATFEAEEGTIITDVKADINPVQDLHGYDKPWAGGNGKNLFDRESAVAGYINISGAVSGADPVQLEVVSDYIRITPSTAYIFSGNVNNSEVKWVGIGLYDENKGFITRIAGLRGTGTRFDLALTTTQTANAYYVRISYRTYGIDTEAQFELGSTTTPWTPYSNICLISGYDEVKAYVTGFNQWDEEWERALYNSSGVKVANNSYIASSNLIPVFPNTDYYILLKTVGAGVSFFLCEYDVNKTFIQRLSWGSSTVERGYVNRSSENARYWTFCVGGSMTPITTYNNDISINYPSTDHEYHTYNGQTYTTALGRTVYGGTLDVVSGELTVDRAIVDLGTLTWTKEATEHRFVVNLSTAGIGIITPPWTQSYLANAICSNYAITTRQELLNSDGTLSIHYSGAIYLNIHDENAWVNDTAEQFKTAMSGVQLCYELATPLTVQLTPTEVKTLLGTNNIWADSGDITVKYGTSPYIIVNPTDFPSKPLLEVTGVGSFWLGDTQITITGTSGQIIYIDCETGECYKATGGIISPANGLVTLNRLDFPKLASGINNIQLGSGISKVKITPRWWRL